MRPNILTVGTGVIALTLSLAACTAADQPETLSTERDTAPTAEPSSTADPTADYRDGVFTATGFYGGGQASHDVTLTIEGDAVAAVEITTPAVNETSLGYQQRFAEALPDAIIGRNIDELDIDRLAGSSNSPKGFMDALEKIKAEAAL